MAPSGKRFAARDFLSIIEAGDEAMPLAVEGMVKGDPNDPESLLFSPGLSCGRWVKLPVSAIESVTALRQVRCDDHSHHIVSIVFHAATTPEAAAFAALAGAYEELLLRAAQQSQRMTAALPRPRAPALSAARLQVEEQFEGDGTGAAGPTEDCKAKCKREHPDSWFDRFLCGLYCP